MSLSPKVLLVRALLGHHHVAVSIRYQVGASDAASSSGPILAGTRSTAINLHNGWTVTTASTQPIGDLFTNHSALAVLIAGIVMSLLLGALMYILGTGRGRALRLVANKTGELQHMAMHDTLTGLPNLALILDRTEQALSGARREGTAIGLMFLDLDGFKGINDTFGHATGDEFALRGRGPLARTATTQRHRRTSRRR